MPITSVQLIAAGTAKGKVIALANIDRVITTVVSVFRGRGDRNEGRWISILAPGQVSGIT